MATPSATLDPEAVACGQTPLPGSLVDERNGFAMSLPERWQNLRPGDQGWVVIYGSHDSATEKAVADGTIADFASPVPTDATDLVNLAVYVRAAAPGATLDSLLSAYSGILQSQPNGSVLPSDIIALPAGDAGRVEGTWEYTANPGRRHTVAYILLHGGRTYHLVFAGLDSRFDAWKDSFHCMARTLRWLDGRSSPVPATAAPSS